MAMNMGFSYSMEFYVIITGNFIALDDKHGKETSKPIRAFVGR